MYRCRFDESTLFSYLWDFTNLLLKSTNFTGNFWWKIHEVYIRPEWSADTTKYLDFSGYSTLMGPNACEFIISINYDAEVDSFENGKRGNFPRTQMSWVSFQFISQIFTPLFLLSHPILRRWFKFTFPSRLCHLITSVSRSLISVSLLCWFLLRLTLGWMTFLISLSSR